MTTALQPYRILIVEDDESLGYLLKTLLEREGFQPYWCKDGIEGLKTYQPGSHDLCLLDVSIPGLDGFGLARRLKTLDPDVKFLFLTARSLKEDVMQGYALGAEDYIRKPFDTEELLCKLQVLRRRRQSTAGMEAPDPAHYQIGQYDFDYARRELRLGSSSKRLTHKENEILRLLCLHQKQILRREDAVQLIYGKSDYFLGRSFDVFISRIRKYLSEDPAIAIENVFGTGFILHVGAATDTQKSS